MIIFDWVMLVIGLIICFAGLKIRRLCNAIIGFFGGLVIGYIVLLICAFSSGGLAYIADDDAVSWIILLLIAIGAAVLSVVLDRIIVVIQSFVVSFILSLIFFMFLFDKETTLIVIMAFVAAIVAAYASYFYHKYAYVIVTAFLGALIASTTAYSIFSDAAKTNALVRMTAYGIEVEENIFILFSTILLGIAGCYVQIKTNKDIFDAKDVNHSTENGLGRRMGSYTSSGMDLNKGFHMAPDMDRQDNFRKKYIDWNSIGTALKRDKYLLLIPLITFVFEPLLESMAAYANPGMVFWNFMLYCSWILTAVSIGILVYLIIRKRMESVIAIQLLFIMGYLIQHSAHVLWLDYWALFYGVLHLLLTTVVLLLENRYIPDNVVKNTILTVSAIVLYYWVINWIFYSFYFSFGYYEAIGVIFVFATIYYLIRGYVREDRCLRIALVVAVVVSVAICIYRYTENRQYYIPTAEMQYETELVESELYMETQKVPETEYIKDNNDADNEYSSIDGNNDVSSHDVDYTGETVLSDYEGNLYQAMDGDAGIYILVEKGVDDSHIIISLTNSPYNMDFSYIEFEGVLSGGKFIANTQHKNDLLIDSFRIDEDEIVIIDDDYISFFEAKSPDIESFGRHFKRVASISEDDELGSAGKSNNWQEARSAYSEKLYNILGDISDSGVSENYRFALAYIDEDVIPELIVLSRWDYGDVVEIYHYIDGEVELIVNWTSDGGLLYEEKGNSMGFVWNEQGYSSFYVAKIVDNFIEDVVFFECNSNAADASYQIDGEYVSQEEYEELISAYAVEFHWVSAYYEDCWALDAYNISSMYDNPERYLVGESIG